MRVSVSIDDDIYEQCLKLKVERHDSTMSKTMLHLIKAGLVCEAGKGEQRRSRDAIDSRLAEFERNIRKENDAVLEKAVSKLDKAVGKVSSIQKQSINAAAASSGSLIAVITLMACYLADHDGHDQWEPLLFDDRWRFFFGTGRQLVFEKDPMRNFYHAFSGAPERTGNEFASLADIYCEGDEAYAEKLMSRPDTVGLDYLARHSEDGE